MKPTRTVYAGVFLISVAALALEVLQMRIFAFAMWHHLAFLVVSIAILGFGAAGAFLAMARFLRDAHLGRSIACAGLLFAASTLAGPYYLAQHPVDVFNQFGGAEVLATIVYYVLFALPYFFAGWIITVCLTQCAESVAKLYFANMVGSGAGCFAIFLLLEPLGAEGMLVVLALAGCVVALLAPCGIVLRGIAALALAAGLSILPGINEHVRGFMDPLVAKLPKLDGKDPATHPHRWHSAREWFRFRPTDSKFIATYRHHNATTLASRWTPLGRIDILSDPTVASPSGVPGACLFQDGDAPGQMPHREFVVPATQIHAIGYAVKKQPNVLIIGVGGGLDVKTALDHGARKITGVEINPTTLELYRGEFAELTGNPAGHAPRSPQGGAATPVELVVAEGRHFVRRSDERYDLIQMSGVDTYTALANGAYVLSESYLYTREAFDDYLDSLTDDGLLVMIRFAWPKPRETLRALSIALQTLQSRGIAEPWQHVAVLRNEKAAAAETTRLGALLVKRSAFTPAEAETLRGWADAAGFSTDWLPHPATANGGAAKNAFADLVAAMKAGALAGYIDGYEFRIDSVRDDAPFFFDQHRLSAVTDWLGSEKPQAPEARSGPVWAAHLEVMQKRPVGLLLLSLTIGQLAVLVLLLIFVPLLFVRRGLAGGSVGAPLGYFLCLGLGYILLMISAMQRFGLILGHPTYAITVTMATFLIASGIGSWLSGRVSLRAAPALLVVVALCLCGAAAAFWHYQAPLGDWLLAQSFALRVLVIVGLLAPIAMLMGTCFPTGIRVLAGDRRPLIPWAYGVNAGASVLGSVLAVVLAMSLGFTRVQWVSAGLYVVAALLMFRMRRAPGAITSGNP